MIFDQADLKDASICDSNLVRTRFTHADFQGATLDGSNFQLADLRKAKNITAQQLARAVMLDDVQADLPLLRELKRLAPEKLEWWDDPGDEDTADGAPAEPE